MPTGDGPVGDPGVAGSGAGGRWGAAADRGQGPGWRARGGSAGAVGDGTLTRVSVGRMGSGTSPVQSGSVEEAVGQLVPGEVTRAVFTTFPVGSTAVGGNGFAADVTMLIVEVAPAAMVPRLQVTTWPAAVQAGVDDTNVRPTGKVSVTTTLVAWLPPRVPHRQRVRHLCARHDLGRRRCLVKNESGCTVREGAEDRLTGRRSVGERPPVARRDHCVGPGCGIHRSSCSWPGSSCRLRSR